MTLSTHQLNQLNQLNRSPRVNILPTAKRSPIAIFARLVRAALGLPTCMHNLELE
jgi:hypothetical protein